MGLLPRRGNRVEGTAVFDGEDLLALSPSAMRDRRGADIAMIFQDPLSSLNPVVSIGRQVTEVMERHQGLSRKEATPKAADLLERVGIPDPKARLVNYPHQLSGGMRQRALIAMALACKPAPADRRRADHGARRDDPGADPGAAQGARRRHRHRAGDDHPRPRRGRGPVRRGQRALRRQGRRARRPARAVQAAAAPLHGRAAQLDPAPRRPARGAAQPGARARWPTTCRGPPRAPSRRAARTSWTSARSRTPEWEGDQVVGLRCFNPMGGPQ